ncbi:GrpB family protein [Priestia megaterium]|uniref:GrpB family protein n=1 Tax=Priestia megaterium TaxID=1404 RepID=UPI00366CD8E9
MNITMVEHNPNWKYEYLNEEFLIKETLQKELVNIFHIGSTAIQDVKAKPIIDILLVVNDIEELDNYSDQFEKLGYEVMGEFGIKKRRYYRKGGDNRTHQIHAFQYDNLQEIERHLSFRDYLRQNQMRRNEYGTLKAELAHRFPNDIKSYSNGKDKFVKRTEKEALKWHWFNR